MASDEAGTGHWPRREMLFGLAERREKCADKSS